MTLLELAEPLFQYVCRLNRSARKGGRLEHAQVRSELEELFEQMRERAGKEKRLKQQYARMELVLMYFTDFLVKEAGLPFSGEWRDMSREHGGEDGDEAFWDELADTLEDRSSESSERLAVFYVCIGLGFTGFYAGQHEFLRRKMLEISSRIGSQMDKDGFGKICPEAYEHLNTADFTEPPAGKMIGVGIAVLCLLVVVFAANIAAYRSAYSRLATSLQRINGDHRNADARGDAGAPPATSTGGRGESNGN